MENDYYVNIPYVILKNKNMNDKEKILLSLVSGFFDGEFHMSNSTIGRIMGTSARTVQRTFLGLRKKGLVFCKNIIEDGNMVGRVVTLNNSNALIKKINRE